MLFLYQASGGDGEGRIALTAFRYHDENTKIEDLIHPEDIEHFKRHDELEEEADRVAALDKMAIVEQNIPWKFRRDPL
jgi:hypothetical protein